MTGQSLVAFRCLLVVLGLLPWSTASAQGVDTVKKAAPLFRWRDAVVGAGVVATAAVLVPFDARLGEVFVDVGPRKNSIAYTTSKVFDKLGSPGAVIVGVGAYALGRLTGRNRLADLGLHTSEALILSGAETFALKGLAGRDRPVLDPNDADRFRFGRGFGGGFHNSMPSGHTTAAFAAVSAINSEIQSWRPRGPAYVGPLLYLGAGLVGAARVYGLKHWPRDVIVGALVGTSAGIKVVRYKHAHPNKRIDRWLGAISVGASPVKPGTLLLTVGS